MSDKNLSPEEILREKEISGGIVYDDPNGLNLDTELSGNVYSKESSPKTNDLPSEPLVQESETRPLDLGWKNLPIGMLPSQGLFYPESSRIAIRPAEVKEIRQFSTIDEDDMLDIDDKLNYILDSCCRIKFDESGVVSYKDLKQEDRFFIIMAIRDLTFVQGENRIIVNPEGGCTTKGCNGMEGIELRTGVLSNYDINEDLKKFYSHSERCFVFPIRRIGKTIKMIPPSIGVTKAISSFVRDAVKRGDEVDESFIKIAPFYLSEWRGLDYFKIKEAMVSSSEEWTKEEFSAYFELAERIKIGTDLKIRVKCDSCGDGEVTAPIYFPSGFRSLFVISDIFRELF
jgi:hypothetical protein